MSFTALLLPLQLQLTYYQYLAGKNSSPRAFLPGALPVGTRCKHRAAGRPLTLRVTQVPAPLPTLPRLYSSLHTPVQLFLDLLTSLDLSGRRPPPSSPPPSRVLCCLETHPAKLPAGTYTHPPGPDLGIPARAPPCAPPPAPAQLCSACSSTSPPAEPGGATQGGTARSP